MSFITDSASVPSSRSASAGGSTAEPSATPGAVRPPTPSPAGVGPDLLEVRTWADPVIDRVGHDPRSEYVERFWLGIVGPTCTWLLRHLAVRFDAEPDGFRLDVATTARALGLGAGLGRQAPLGRAVTRCSQFGLAQRFGTAGLVVRRRLPPLARHQVARLPEAIQAEHTRWLEAQLRAGTAEDERRQRAQQLALTLARAGEAPDAVRAQLERWHYPAELSAEATRWAAARLAHPPAGATGRDVGITPSAQAGDDAA